MKIINKEVFKAIFNKALRKYHKDNVVTKQDKLVSGTNVKTINGKSILGDGNLEVAGGNANLNIAALALSTTITNGKQGEEVVIGNATNDTSILIRANGAQGARWTQNILPTKPYVDNTYQKKEVGKGLSTNDFTNADKIKLSELTPFVELTQAEYDALTEEEKTNGTVYFIKDAESGGSGGGKPTYTELYSNNEAQTANFNIIINENIYEKYDSLLVVACNFSGSYQTQKQFREIPLQWNDYNRDRYGISHFSSWSISIFITDFITSSGTCAVNVRDIVNNTGINCGICKIYGVKY